MAEPNSERNERITEAEHAIMEVIWDRHPLSASEVCDDV